MDGNRLFSAELFRRWLLLGVFFCGECLFVLGCSSASIAVQRYKFVRVVGLDKRNVRLRVLDRNDGQALKLLLPQFSFVGDDMNRN